MRWYNHLYEGEKAGEKRFKIIQSIRAHKPLAGVYVITPAINGNNILEVYQANELERPYYQEKNMLVIGIAADYWEALLVVRQIVDDLYQKTGGFDLRMLIE